MGSAIGLFEPLQKDPTSNDVDRFFTELFQIAKQRNYRVNKLGDLGTDALYLLVPPKPIKSHRLLVSAGFHGNEPAGCWGVLNFLKKVPQSLLDKISVSFLPMVNPTGARRHNPCNIWQGSPNRGFVPRYPSTQQRPTIEGQLLLKNLKLLLFLAKDGFHTLHEDYEQNRFYLYSNEDRDTPGEFTKYMIGVGKSMCDLVPNGKYETGMVQDGVIFNLCDGSFETLLCDHDIPRIICTETPSKLDFPFRVNMSTALILAFVRYHVNKFFIR